ncbi:Uu.00g120840.m01.CDS01 [Anthostomella pinea]|uniref:Molybdate-anion transporter n=1 Tax=Anthostomella pinea TaxID=933095 RepID=A0AAI8VHV2_9PEZI|nr:Uu.00g120840.m01.CDS01 [Anthostomella pinea]
MSYYYQTSFCALIALCALLLVSQPVGRNESKRQAEARKQPVSRHDEHPDKNWYRAYALVMAADWLQGPYLYSLYRDEHGLSSSLATTLSTTGFVSSAISAYFVGVFADKYGRKLACMTYCVLYSISCFLTITSVVPLLFLGRVLGGISTSILFSVFDSWMVTNFRERKLVENGCDLSRTYAATSTVNSFTAIVSGVMSEVLVRLTGSRKTPFLLSGVLLWSALIIIWSHWAENYGAEASPEASGAPKSPNLWSVFKQPSIMALVFVSTMFEGSMYLFVFFWTPALESVQKSSGDLPYGFIFSSFMASSTAAALVFNIVMQRRVVKYSRLLVGIMLAANFCFMKLAGPKTEDAAFWLFCLFEACVGMYWPCIGYLKGRLVGDSDRAKVYSIMRVPLNVFVVVSLMLAGESDNFNKVFSTCSVLLTASFAIMWAASMKESMP